MTRTDTSHSTADVARRLGVSIPTVQRWVDQGYLKAWKTVGGHRRIDDESLQQFMARNGVRDEVAAAHATPGAAGGDTGTHAGDGPSVLIVDDNPDDRDLLTAMVEAALPGARIDLATNGFEALMCIGRTRPQVVISDLLMPHMNGLEMLRHLGADTDPAARPRLIVAVSSETPLRLAHLGALPRGVRFLQKPVRPAELAATLHEGLAVADAPAPGAHAPR